MPLYDSTVLQPTQRIFHTLIRPSGNGIFARFDALHIDADNSSDIESVFSASAGYMGSIGTCDHRLGGYAARIHARAAKQVTFNDGNRLLCVREPRSQGGARLPRPDDNGVEVFHSCHPTPMPQADSALIVPPQHRLPRIDGRLQRTFSSFRHRAFRIPQRKPCTIPNKWHKPGKQVPIRL
jgi:hypothetical protein